MATSTPKQQAVLAVAMFCSFIPIPFAMGFIRPIARDQGSDYLTFRSNMDYPLSKQEDKLPHRLTNVFLFGPFAYLLLILFRRTSPAQFLAVFYSLFHMAFMRWSLQEEGASYVVLPAC